MKHYLDLVSISNKVHRRQSRMTRICIVLAVFLVAVMFGLADMYLKSMTDETRHQTGDWHCKITAIDEKTSEYIAARPEIDLSGWQGNIPAEIGCTVADQPVSVAGMDETIFSEIYLGSVLSGEFPEIAGQVAVSSTLAQTAGISLGDTLTLNSPDGSTMQLAITGIMDDDAANMISGSASAVLLTPEGLSSIQTADLSGNWQYVVRFSLLTNVGSSIADIQQHITPHMFRHSFATYLWEQCGNIYEVKEILGHSSVKTTERYVHASFEQQKRILTTMHPRNTLKIEF